KTPCVAGCVGPRFKVIKSSCGSLSSKTGELCDIFEIDLLIPQQLIVQSTNPFYPLYWDLQAGIPCASETPPSHPYSGCGANPDVLQNSPHKNHRSLVPSNWHRSTIRWPSESLNPFWTTAL